MDHWIENNNAFLFLYTVLHCMVQFIKCDECVLLNCNALIWDETQAGKGNNLLHPGNFYFIFFIKLELSEITGWYNQQNVWMYCIILVIRPYYFTLLFKKKNQSTINCRCVNLHVCVCWSISFHFTTLSETTKHFHDLRKNLLSRKFF